MFEPDALDPAVHLLAELAGGESALEFGLGTGRIALPLAARGIAVHGIDLSDAMLAEFHNKPGSERIGVTVGDFATARAPGDYPLAFLVFNTINNLTTQDEQVACFANAARHLRPGGRFLVEVSVPQLQRLPPGETAHTFAITPNYVGIDEYDVLGQRLVSHHFTLTDGRWQERSLSFRYAWPAELDLMARLAGMALESRWAGFRREPFTAESRSHVSVWRLPA
jgi:SAM-dependent methyltransferase